VLAVGQLAHVIEEHPQTRSVWIALGLFVTLWWTWIGFRGALQPVRLGLVRGAAGVPGRQRARRRRAGGARARLATRGRRFIPTELREPSSAPHG
jgi:hypothetical protein